MIHTQKMNSKWIRDLNVIPETIKSLEENLGRKLPGITLSDVSVDPASKCKERKAKINK